MCLKTKKRKDSARKNGKLLALVVPVRELLDVTSKNVKGMDIQ
jgi:hypothetical protein